MSKRLESAVPIDTGVAEVVPASPRRRRYLKMAGTMPALPVLGGCEWWFGSSSDSNEGQSYRRTIADGRQAIEQAMAATDTGSVSVGLWVDGETVWQEAFGVIDRRSHQAATPQTLYNIGSCSKVLAATAIMILVDRGRIDLEAPVTRYLPDFRMLAPGYTQITVRMLLNHSSALPGSTLRDIFLFRPWDGYAAAVQETLTHHHLKAVPGAFSVYCNDGFTLAQAVVAAVSGQAYASFVQQEIFAPLGMSATRFPLEPFPKNTFALGYQNGVDWPQEFVVAYGTGGAASTPGDMLRLGAMFVGRGQYEGRRILSEAAVREMATNQTLGMPLYPFPDFPWGLGWDTVRQPGLAAEGITAWQKNGGTAFYGSDFFVLPNQNMVLMITGNSLDYGAGRLGERILLHALVDRGNIARVPSPITRSNATTTTASDAQLNALVGFYGSHTGLFRIEREGSNSLRLSAWQDGQWRVLESNLRLHADGYFSNGENPLVRWRLESVGGIQWLIQRRTINHAHYWVDIPHAERISALAPISPAWRSRLGRRWLLVNEDWASVLLTFEGPGGTLSECPDLPGYILVMGEQVSRPTSDTHSGMVLQIPVNAGRDLFEVRVQVREGGEWLWVNGQWFRPLETVASLAQGSHVVTLDADGFTEWRWLPAGANIQLQGSQAAWKLYGESLEALSDGEGNGQFVVPAGGRALLGIYGSAGASASVLIT